MNELINQLPAGMSNAILVLLLTSFVALNGIVFDVKKDPNGKPSLSNLSSIGKAFILVILVLGLSTCSKQIADGQESAKQADELDLANARLKEQEIKVEAINIMTQNIKEITDDISDISTATNTLVTDSKSIVTRNNELLVELSELYSQREKDDKEAEQEINDQIALNQSLQLQITQLKIENASLHQGVVKRAPEKLAVRFSGLEVGENCEKANDEGEFYYELFVNSYPVANPRYNLKDVLRLKDNSIYNQPLGDAVIVTVYDKDEQIIVSGYVRERDPKNFFANWTYKYAGRFSAPLPAEPKRHLLSVVNEQDCQIKLAVELTKV